MNDLVSGNLHQKIAQELMAGHMPRDIVTKLNCGYSEVFEVLSDGDFSLKISSLVESQARSFGLSALNRVAQMATGSINGGKVSHATMLNANVKLLEMAKDYKVANNEDKPIEDMTQQELHDRMQAMQGEHDKRVIDVTPTTSLDDLLG